MSKSDNIVRLPKVSTRTLTESDDMGDYTFTVSDDRKRALVKGDREQKRETIQHRVTSKRNVDDLDFADQVRDALYTPEYTGPVGTRLPEWERVLLHTCDINCITQAREIRLSTCEYGCKVYDTPCGELIFHSGVYGHAEFSVEVAPKPVKIVHVTPKRERMNAPKPRRERSHESLEREMRSLGFGGRYGVHL